MANANRTPKNLVDRWRPGQSGNPKGRPIGPSLTTLIRRALNQRELGGQLTPGNQTVAGLLAESMIAHAIKGNAAHMREILNRVHVPVRPVLSESECPDSVVISTPDNGRDRCADEPVVSEVLLDHWEMGRASRISSEVTLTNGPASFDENGLSR
jgi:hypothetical protein